MMEYQIIPVYTIKSPIIIFINIWTSGNLFYSKWPEWHQFIVCSTDLTSLFCLLLCSLLLAVVRSAGQVIRVEPCGSTVAPCGATVAPHGSTYNIFMYLFLFIYCTSDRWRHVAPQWRHRVPQGCHPITWPADLTTANRSAHNSKQNKLVRSVEQTRQNSVSNTDYGFLFTILRLLCSSNADGTDL